MYYLQPYYLYCIQANDLADGTRARESDTASGDLPNTNKSRTKKKRKPKRNKNAFGFISIRTRATTRIPKTFSRLVV